MDYPFDRAMRGGFRPLRQDSPDAHGNPQAQVARRTWTLREYLGYNIRHQLLFIAVPVGLILLATGCLPWVVSRVTPDSLAEYVLPALMMLTAGAVFLFAPLLIARIWKTHRLPSGHLRDELEATCRNLSLTYRDILVWESGGMVTNAGVMGLIGPLRYILLSDALLEGMDRRDVEAIFAHEAGHIIHHHIFYAVLFALGTITICVSVIEQLSLVLTVPDWFVQPLAMGLLLVVWGGGFGWLSRRFERQSDVVAAWASGRRGEGDRADLITHEGAAVFARALQRVGELNGIPARQRNWRHGSIAQRVGYVLWLGSTSGTRERDDRKVRRIKWALWVLAAAGVALVVHMWGQF
jgi:STE24 endopeptidase